MFFIIPQFNTNTMNYQSLSETFRRLHTQKAINSAISLNKHNQGYKQTYLYESPHLRVHFSNIKNT